MEKYDLIIKSRLAEGVITIHTIPLRNTASAINNILINTTTNMERFATKSCPNIGDKIFISVVLTNILLSNYCLLSEIDAMCGDGEYLQAIDSSKLDDLYYKGKDGEK